MASSSSSSSVVVTQPQVFINFRGIDLRNDFVDSLAHEMKKEKLNVFTDEDLVRGLDLQELLVEIEKSTVAIVIFSKNYTNSDWCLKELARINDCVDRGTLMAIPIFYKIETLVVKDLTGDFGDAFRSLKDKHGHDPTTKKWEKAIASITRKSGMELQEHGKIPDRIFREKVIVEVKKSLEYIRKKTDKGRQTETIQNIQSAAVQIRQSESIQNKQPEAVQVQQPVVTPQGSTFNVGQLKISGSHNARHWTFVSISESPNDKSDQDFICSIVTEVKKVLLNISRGINGENDRDFSVAGRKLTITTYTPNEGAVEVPVLNNMTENLQMRPSYEFKFEDLHRPNGNVFIINARDLSIEWSENPNHWMWLPLPNQDPKGMSITIKTIFSSETVEAAFLRKASWLDIAGSFDTRYLTPRTRYEVVFTVKLDCATLAWETPVKLKLVLHSNKKKTLERSVDMVEYMSKQWVDILVGEFTTSWKNIGDISFAMYEHQCQLWKSGLFVKGVVIRPKY